VAAFISIRDPARNRRVHSCSRPAGREGNALSIVIAFREFPTLESSDGYRRRDDGGERTDAAIYLGRIREVLDSAELALGRFKDP